MLLYVTAQQQPSPALGWNADLARGLVGAQFTKAVEAKQVAQQDAERARFVVLKADQARASTLGDGSCACSLTSLAEACAMRMFPRPPHMFLLLTSN